VAVVQGQAFKGRQFAAEVILWAVRWYLMFPISCGVSVDHTTLFRWIQAYAPELEKRIRPHLRPTNGSWRVDETYVRVKGKWTYLYRAVDSTGATIDFLLAARRDAAAAKRFLQNALRAPGHPRPRVINVDGNPSYPKVVAELKGERKLGRRCRCRTCPYLNNISGTRSSGDQTTGQRQPGVPILSRGPADDPRI